ncbi:MAG: hypothetical protein NT069_06995 [Planctomycetota bacterium]|nr:hypothetical protein [Planctomycetota bacterium]
MWTRITCREEDFLDEIWVLDLGDEDFLLYDAGNTVRVKAPLEFAVEKITDLQLRPPRVGFSIEVDDGKWEFEAPEGVYVDLEQYLAKSVAADRSRGTAAIFAAEIGWMLVSMCCLAGTVALGWMWLCINDPASRKPIWRVVFGLIALGGLSFRKYIETRTKLRDVKYYRSQAPDDRK